MAKHLIKELHPIKDTRIEVSFPVSCFGVGLIRKMWRYFNPHEVDLMEPLMEDQPKADPMDEAKTPEAKKILKLQ